MLAFFITILIIAALLILYGISTHNNIIAIYNACQRAWADVITQELQKNRLLPTLEKMVEEYKIHEASVLENVTELRTALKNISPEHTDIKALKAVAEQSKHLLANINMVSENYPELKASDIYQSFMRELTELEGNIAASIRIFNANVERFNTKIEVFPNVLINNYFTHKKRLEVFTDTTAQSGFEYTPNF